MPIIAKGTNSDNFEIAPTGLQNALCVFAEDIGTHSNEYKGESKPKLTHKVVIVFQLEALITEGKFAGQPFLLSIKENLSIDTRANLTAFLESWRGRAFSDEQREQGFDVEKLINVPCTLSVIHKDKVRGGKKAVINMIVPKQPTAKTLEKIATKPPAWIQNEREKSLEYQEMAKKSEGLSETMNPNELPVFDDDLPF